MIERYREYIVGLLCRFWSFLEPLLKPFFRFIVVSAILAAGWYAFLSLVSYPPIDATPVLIMVWSSIIVLFLALFPKIIDRIKRIKIKDIEIELQDTIAKSSPDEYISLSDLDEYSFSQKGDFRNLNEIIYQSFRQPLKPILLTANIKDGQYISIPMLFIYLFFLDLLGKTTTVLFISTNKRLSEISDIRRDSIVGVVSGKSVLQIFFRKFPYFLQIFDLSRGTDFLFNIEELLRHGYFREIPSEIVYQRMYDRLRELQREQGEFLNKQNVRNWFKDVLNNHIVDVALESKDYKTIRDALVKGDEFILTMKDKGIRSVISLCYFSKNLSKKLLADLLINN
jgi:hypothetical protein